MKIVTALLLLACSVAYVASSCDSPTASYTCFRDDKGAPKYAIACKDRTAIKTCDATETCVIGFDTKDNACKEVKAAAECKARGSFAVKDDECKYYAVCTSDDDKNPLIRVCSGDNLYFNNGRCTIAPGADCTPKCTKADENKAHPLNCGLYLSCDGKEWKTGSCMGKFYDKVTKKCVTDKTKCSRTPECTKDLINQRIEDADNKCGFYRKCTPDGWKRLSCMGSFFNAITGKCEKNSKVCGTKERV